MDIDTAYQVVRRSWLAAYIPIFGEKRAEGLRWHAVSRLAILRLWWYAIGRFPANAVLLAIDHGRVVGLLYGQSDKAGDLLVWMLYVDPAHQRTGFGTSLLWQYAKLHPRAKSIRLEVLSKNAEAIAFYERLGFVMTRQLDQDCDDYSTIYMERILPF